MEDYDIPESKFGRIYKVAGPCKQKHRSANPDQALYHKFLTFWFVSSGRR